MDKRLTENREPAPARRVAPYVPAVVAGLLIRWAVIPFLYRDWLDPFVLEHWAFGRVGRSIALGHGFGSPLADTGLSALLPPVYPYVIAAIFKLSGVYSTTSIVTILALNSVLSALTCIPIFYVARKSFGDRAGTWAAWAWALFPYGIYYGADWAWSTCLVALLLCCLFLFAMYLEETGSLLHWIGFGLLGGLAALTEPVVLSVVPFLGLCTCYQRLRKKRSWLIPGAVAALAAIAVVAPWVLRDYAIFHRFIPIRSGYGMELYIGNNGYSTRWVNSSLHPNHNAAEQAELERVGEVAYMDHKREQAEAYIHAHRGWYAWMTFRRAVYMWTGYWSFSPEYLKEEPLDPPNIFVQTTVSLLALCGLWRAFRTDKLLGVRFAIVLAFFPAAYYFSHPETYYLRPADPIFVVLAASACAIWFASPKSAQTGLP
jgi:4-amino-4-deoxy-L-arabinose transferase-like glycosyltransferase